MQETPVPSFFADLSASERATVFTDARVRTLQAAFASIPDPRQRRGQRYDLPFLSSPPDLFRGRAGVRLQCIGGRRALDAGSAQRCGPCVRVTPSSEPTGSL